MALFARPRSILRISYALSLASLVRQTSATKACLRQNQCPVRSILPPSTLEGGKTFCTASIGSGADDHPKPFSSEIDTAELAKILTQNEDVLLIDVREEWEVEEMGKIATRAINIPLGDVETALGEESPEKFRQKYQASLPAKNQDIIFYCMAGIRSLDALETAQDLGFTNARHYIRGWLGWQIFNESK